MPLWYAISIVCFILLLSLRDVRAGAFATLLGFGMYEIAYHAFTLELQVITAVTINFALFLFMLNKYFLTAIMSLILVFTNVLVWFYVYHKMDTNAFEMVSCVVIYAQILSLLFRGFIDGLVGRSERNSNAFILLISNHGLSDVVSKKNKTSAAK